MAPRLSGQSCIFGVVFFVSKSLLGIEGQKKVEKFAILTRKPRSHDISNVAYYILKEYIILEIISVCSRRHKILKSKPKEPLKVLSSSGIRDTEFIYVHNYPAFGNQLILNIAVMAVRA